MSRLLTIGVMQQARNIVGGGGPTDPTATPEEYFQTIDVTGGCRIENETNSASSAYDTEGGLDVIIPQFIDGKQVLEIGGAAFRNLGITSVVLPIGLVSIRPAPGSTYGAFYGNSLQSVALPVSLKLVGDSSNSYGNAFRHNPDFGTLTVPSSSALEVIGSAAFQRNTGTGGIASIDLSNAASLTDIKTNAFAGRPIVEARLPASVTIGVNAATLGTNGLKAAYEANDSLAGLYEYDSGTSTWDFTPEA